MERPSLPGRSMLAADLDKAKITEPEVPVSKRYPTDRKAPSRKLRAEGEQLAEQKAHYLAGAVHETYGRLRSPRLSDGVAAAYWNRFLLIAGWMDEHQGGPFDTVQEYLTAENLEAFWSFLGEKGVEKKGGKRVPASSGWVDSLQRVLNSLLYCFL